MNYEENKFSTVVEIVGLEEGGRGKSCPKHAACGSCVAKHIILQVHRVAIVNNEGLHEDALAVFALKYKKETCLVGFLKRHCLPFNLLYDEKFNQVTQLFSKSQDYDNLEHNRCMHGAAEAYVIM